MSLLSNQDYIMKTFFLESLLVLALLALVIIATPFIILSLLWDSLWYYEPVITEPMKKTGKKKNKLIVYKLH